jgi:membrane associated rhomboid family serine protease
MYDRSPFHLTPWVRRLLVATAAVYLLQKTVFTSPWLVHTFGFVPTDALRHPWSAVSYAFLHGGFLHLLFNALLLFMFGSPVEGRLGSRSFIRLFFIAVLGGAGLSLLLLPIGGNAPIIGASAGIFGVMLAFVLEWPDAPVFIFPFPVPLKAKWVVGGLVALDLVFGMAGAGTGVAHFAHLGGFGAALLYLRGGSVLARARPARTRERTPAVLVRPTADATRRETFGPGSPPRRTPDAAVRAEVDRVLDKISERGLESLTAEERRFLDEMSKRFRQQD